MPRLTIIALAMLAGHVIAFPAHAEECFTWQEAPAVNRAAPPATTPKRVRRSTQPVRHRAKRIKRATPAVMPTTRDLPTLIRVPIACPAVTVMPLVPAPLVPPVIDLPGRSYSRIPVNYSPLPAYVPPVAVLPPPAWLQGPLAVIPFGGFYPPQSNDLPTFPPFGVRTDSPGAPVWVPPVVTPGTPAQVPVPGTLFLLAAGVVAVWRMKR